MDNNETYVPITLEGAAFYKNIKSVEFTPMSVLEELKVAVPKGKIYFWKLLGFIPLIPLRAKHDLYEANGFTRCFAPLKQAVSSWYYNGHYVLKGKTVYSKAEVRVNYIDYDNNFCRRFDTDEEAMEYLNEIKSKCKKYENYLN